VVKMDLEQGATPELETTEVIEQPKSMDDTIRETLHSLQERGIDTDPSEPVEATPEEKAQRIRDEQGKFAAKPAEAAVVEPVAAEPAAVPKELQSLGFKKEEADAFAAAPQILKDAFIRRSEEMHRGIEGFRAAAGFGQSMERAMTPYAATLQSLNISADKAVGELMAADQRMRNGDIQYFASLAKAYNFNPAQLAEIFGGQQPQGEQYIDPNLNALQQQVQQLTGYIQNQQQTTQQQAQETLNSEISAFAADPSHSHFESVRGHMSALLQAGQAKDLADAYEQAIYANPSTRAAVLQQQAVAQREEAAKKAQAAKAAASVNVRARPSMPASQPIGTMDDTIRATLRRLQGA
jgi:hypothetical protein